MNYPFEFKEMLLTDRSLDKIGFSEYWGDAGESGTRTLQLADKVFYRIHDMDELDDQCGGYCGEEEYYPGHFTTNNWHTIYFLHEMYEDVKERSPEYLEIFVEKCKKVNMLPYIKSYLNYIENGK